MEQNQSEPDNTVARVYEYVASRIVNEKKFGFEVKQELVDKGMPEEVAGKIVDEVELQIAQAKKERANKDMLYGSLWFIGGVIVTAVSYSAAGGGGRYVITWGAIIFGAVQFIRGLSNASSSD